MATVLITGCSSGFGKLAVKTFATNGWNVAATMRAPDAESDLVASDNILIARLDVTDPKSIEDTVAETLRKYGSIDCLVNNAGFGGHSLFEQASDKDIRRMFETNVFGPMNTMRSVLPGMRENGCGTVINVTSMAGLFGLPGSSIYSSTKYALTGLTEALALEYKPFGIKFYTVAPGAYPTTGFGENTADSLDTGDEQLIAYSHLLHSKIQTVGEQMAHQGEGLSDPQEVADAIYTCATEHRPIHNPVGADSDLLVTMIGASDRQVFLDQISGMLVPEKQA